MSRRKATASATAIPPKEIRKDSLSAVSEEMSKANNRLEALVGRLSCLYDLIVGPRVETVTGADVDAQKSVGQSFLTVAETKLNRGFDLMSKAESLVEDIIASSE